MFSQINSALFWNALLDIYLIISVVIVDIVESTAFHRENSIFFLVSQTDYRLIEVASIIFYLALFKDSPGIIASMKAVRGNAVSSRNSAANLLRPRNTISMNELDTNNNNTTTVTNKSFSDNSNKSDSDIVAEDSTSSVPVELQLQAGSSGDAVVEPTTTSDNVPSSSSSNV